MALYIVRSEQGSFWNGALYAYGEQITVPDTEEPSVYWEAVDASAKRAVEKRNKEKESLKYVLSPSKIAQNYDLVSDGLRQANPDHFQSKKARVKPKADSVTVHGVEVGNETGSDDESKEEYEVA
ncbi:hypothetical protein [Caudoviricetes sp.]|nr:hypothetical protein [Caudoviricetes sp.]